MGVILKKNPSGAEEQGKVLNQVYLEVSFLRI